VLADVADRLIEFRLAASGDEDVGTFGDEALGGGQADAAVATSDDARPCLAASATWDSSAAREGRSSNGL
jgi:hypothetical protein